MKIKHTQKSSKYKFFIPGLNCCVEKNECKQFKIEWTKTNYKPFYFLNIDKTCEDQKLIVPVKYKILCIPIMSSDTLHHQWERKSLNTCFHHSFDEKYVRNTYPLYFPLMQIPAHIAALN